MIRDSLYVDTFIEIYVERGAVCERGGRLLSLFQQSGMSVCTFKLRRVLALSLSYLLALA